MVSNVYAQNERGISEYEARINSGGLAVARGIVLSDDDKIRRDTIESLMCYGEIDTTAVTRRWSIDFSTYFAHETKALEPLIDDGLANWDGSFLRVTPRGRLLVRNIAMIFDRYLSIGALTPRFSRII